MVSAGAADRRPESDYAQPLGAREFDDLMQSAGVPPGTALCVALSGGGDSMALTLLCDDWCQRHGGTLNALTVDHGLRPGSGAEAIQVGDWLAKAGIAHHILAWDGEKPATGIQAAARHARYRLMTDWARRNGVAHILVAHNLEDQAETFLLRAARGAGLHGLACMAPATRFGGVTIHRPLLGVTRVRLRQTLNSRRQQWIEDPSNSNPAFGRTHIRGLVAALGQAGIPAPRLAALASHFAAVRGRRDEMAETLLAGGVVCHKAGYAELQPGAFRRAPGFVAVHALRRLLGDIGGRDYPPGEGKLDRALGRLLDRQDRRPFTVAGCRIIKSGKDNSGGPFLVCREERNAGERAPVAAGGRFLWRGVFVIALKGRGGGIDGPVYLGPLGPAGWSEIASKALAGDGSLPPFPVRTALPALFDPSGVTEVPHLGYIRAEGRLPTVGIDWVRRMR